ncbi:MAG: NAD(P)/FAD-dependent oxidoreductase, partial [Deltaproteobacteria bacterium]|nr:NAD(P)/FAD-dependent oxidoreductase [Deltaproteobacteria bacterium]
TGYTRKPVRPTWEGMASYRGTLLHSSEYKNGDPWKGRPVLMIGFGNSACEQAIDLVERGAEAHLSVRSAVNVVQRDLLGLVPILAVGATMRHLPTWLADALSWPLVRLTVGDITKVGLKKLPYGPNHQIKHDRRIPLLDIGTMDHIRAGRIRVHGGVTRFTEDGVVFEDGSAHAFDAVVLGTGYRPALEEFLPAAAEVCDPKGMPLASGGQSKLPGLYFCGFYVSPAGMLREIGLEAQRITKEIAS